MYYWGCSSSGRAPALQAGCSGFKSCHLHQVKFMKPHTVNNLDNFISGWYIDPEVCNAVVQKAERDTSVFVQGVKEFYKIVDLKDFDIDLYNAYCNQLHGVIELYKEKYPLCHKEMQVWSFTPPRIQRYNPGEYYSSTHCENNGSAITMNRHLAYMTYLNDISDGGGTEFVLQKLTTPAEKGLTLIWPAGWTHHHKGVVSNTEVKYIITGWLNFSWL